MNDKELSGFAVGAIAFIAIILIMICIYHYFGGWITLLAIGIVLLIEAIVEGNKNE